MRRIALLAVVLLACGPEGRPGGQGPQGPPGPEGPPGPAGGGGGRLTFPAMPAAEQARFIRLGESWTFDLAQPPTTATALYVEVSGCLSAGNNPGAQVRFKTAAAAYAVAVAPVTDCGSAKVQAVEAKYAWLPSEAPHRIAASVPPEFGSVGSPTAIIRALGWYEP